ncbi:hypothetical protein [Streptomyces sp. t39]|uniref:hypothetical protein n=1 Tax=Streptomyces sp. t39 TaxID=1828156 RepID=UPI0011CE547D|nr:hypothetical protein [Streptomyces sp. t39]TXS54365.1 hypothetical protein EAO77_17800 [Streptomyces sp. t39]
MDAGDDGRQQLDAASILNARQTLLGYLGRAGLFTGDAEELVRIVEAGAVALAHEEVGGGGRDAPEGKGDLYTSGWLDGARSVTDDLGDVAARALRQAVAAGPPASAAQPLPPVRTMEVERARVAITPLYLSFTEISDLDPEVSEQVLVAVLATMDPRRRAGYAGRLAEFASEHRPRLERLYARYGPGSPTAIHGRHSLLHSPTSVAVLERLSCVPGPLEAEWDVCELPPAWLEGLRRGWVRPIRPANGDPP